MAMRPEYRAWLEQRLQQELAANGDFEPPWVRFPTLVAGSIGWVTDVFDDPPTWRRYLARWRAPPDDWEAQLGTAISWLHRPS